MLRLCQKIPHPIDIAVGISVYPLTLPPLVEWSGNDKSDFDHQVTNEKQIGDKDLHGKERKTLKRD